MLGSCRIGKGEGGFGSCYVWFFLHQCGVCSNTQRGKREFVSEKCGQREGIERFCGSEVHHESHAEKGGEGNSPPTSLIPLSNSALVIVTAMGYVVLGPVLGLLGYGAACSRGCHRLTTRRRVCHVTRKRTLRRARR